MPTEPMKPFVLNKAIGSVLDEWEALPNDIRGDVGFERMDRAMQQLYKVVVRGETY